MAIQNLTPSITTQPTSLTVSAGQSASLTVVTAGATSYQWRRDGYAIAGANTSTLTLAAVTAADAGDYTVEVSNSFGAVLSQTAHMDVLSPPSIVSLSSSCDKLTQSGALLPDFGTADGVFGR